MVAPLFLSHRDILGSSTPAYAKKVHGYFGDGVCTGGSLKVLGKQLPLARREGEKQTKLSPKIVSL